MTADVAEALREATLQGWMGEWIMGDSELGCCDVCDGPYVLGSDDHNGDTGVHWECEGEVK